MATIINKGTGAGGKNTNVNGKSFEDKTENITRLMKKGYIKTIIDPKKQRQNITIY